MGGWGGFVLKEKLKMIKLALREWHKIDVIKKRLTVLDHEGDDRHLSDF